MSRGSTGAHDRRNLFRRLVGRSLPGSGPAAEAGESEVADGDLRAAAGTWQPQSEASRRALLDRLAADADDAARKGAERGR